MDRLHDVEQFAARNGIILTPADRVKVALVQKAERERLQSLEIGAKSRTWADRWNELYPRVLQGILSAGETLLTLSQTIIVALGIPLVLVLLLVVEHQRVVHGIALFERDAALASFAAAALVLLNLVLEFQVHYVEHRAGYEQERARRWSLRIWARNMAYRLGIGDNWQEQALSPAERYRRLLGLVTFSILALALAGSMRSVIEQTPGAWYEALLSIVRDSDLITILTWTGGLLFAAAAVLSAQGLSRYVAIRCVEIVSVMHQRQATVIDPYMGDVEKAGAAVALALVSEKLARKQSKEVKSESPLEMIQTPIYRNGNGHSGHVPPAN